MRRRTLLIGGVVLAVLAGVAALNAVVDPQNEFYSGDPLTAALASDCLLATDVVNARSYPELKHDLYTRKHPTRVVLASDGRARNGLDLGYPGFDTADVRDTIDFLADAARAPLRVVVVTEPSWFDAETHDASAQESNLAKLGYLLSPRTLGSTLDLVRRSSTLAFTGWQKEPLGRRCVVDRGSSLPAFRPDGTFTKPADDGSATGAFAYDRLTALDDALAVAEGNGWRVAGVSTLAGSEIYRRQLKALFAKHGYRWRVRRMSA